MNQDDFRKLISGQSGGPAAAFLRLFLRAAAWFYSTVIRVRNLLYSKGWLKTHRVKAVVISVGNITAGGTGKTPFVIWLYKFLQQDKIQCAILIRGYKTHTQEEASSIEHRASRTDEPEVLAESCPQAEVIVNPDRVAGAREAVDKFGAKVLIMDDGFQHRRLGRDLDIVTIDATCPFGYGKVLPAGLLREPISALERADAVVITRCDRTDESELSRLEEKLEAVNPGIIIARSIHKPVCVKSLDNKEINIGELKNKKIFAFCGIGNPDAFISTIKKLGANLVGSKIYNDHHRYSENDIADICEQTERSNADLILTTQKDLSKLKIQNSEFRPQFAYLAIKLKFVVGEDKLKGLIEKILAGKILKN